MKKLTYIIIFVLVGLYGLNAHAGPADEAYGEAKACYEDIKNDPKKIKNEKSWVRCIIGFKNVAAKFPQDPKATAAIYSAARLNRELYVKTKDKGYLEESIHLYNSVVKDYSESSLADDALFQIGLLRIAPLKDKERARRAFEAIISRYPEGDMVAKAKSQLEALDGTSDEDATAGAATGATTTAGASIAEGVSAATGATAGAKAGAKAAGAGSKEDKFGEVDLADVAADDTQDDSQDEAMAANTRTGRFSIARLIGMNVSAGKAQTTVTLKLDKPTSFTHKFVDFGRRTKSSAKLTLEFPKTKKGKGIAKTEDVSSAHLQSINVKEGVFSGQLIIRFDLVQDSDYAISKKKGKTVIRFFSKGEKPAAPVDSKSDKESALSTKKLRIVIDPGHGGKDTGAIGPSGVREKTVTLAVSKKLAKELRKKLGATVYLTRTRDVTLPLERRNAFANAKKADLFISVHANASKNRKASGIETYYLNNATDEAARRLAKRENRSAAKPQSEVDKILLTLFQNYNTEESRLLAKKVHSSMIKGLSRRYKNLRDHKVRSALFYVLVGAKCPGILVETSFLSNPTEEKRLINPIYQTRLAETIAAGVNRFVKADKSRFATL